MQRVINSPKVINKGDYISFRKPYLLRVQNSTNRTGYENEYNGYGLVKRI